MITTDYLEEEPEAFRFSAVGWPDPDLDSLAYELHNNVDQEYINEEAVTT